MPLEQTSSGVLLKHPKVSAYLCDLACEIDAPLRGPVQRYYSTERL